MSLKGSRRWVMSTKPSRWVEDVARLPLAFAQVREDALRDVWLVEQLPAPARILMVASGGCTAAVLATLPNVDYLELVDPNPAQLALSRIKLQLLSAPRQERLRMLGHEPMDPSQRFHHLRRVFDELQLSDQVLGPGDLIAQVGPDHAGRYEHLFAQLRSALAPYREALMQLLQSSDPESQCLMVAPDTELGGAIDRAFDEVMALENLVALFGNDATSNRVEPFSKHFARRTRTVLETLPAADNPYLWQVFAGRFPPGKASPWLERISQRRLPRIKLTNSLMDEALERASGEFDYVHLSNILDWLAPDRARHTLEQAWKALRVGGWVMIRQLNSSLDVTGSCDRFEWRADQGVSLNAADRSFFYRHLHLGRKR